MNPEKKRLVEFLEPQMREHGGNLEIAAGVWSLFAVPVADAEGNATARALLADATFAHNTGGSEDDQWIVYFVDTATRATAIHWLENRYRMLLGRIRPVSPEHRALIRDVAGSNMPHRLAQRLTELQARGEITVGCVDEAPVVRALLDRLHVREPLFFSAFLALLTNHLIDLIVLLQQILAEDLKLTNEIVKGSLSGDPFIQSRQDAAAAMRNYLVRFHVINPLDQEKNTAIRNPYSAYMDVFRDNDQITALVDGSSISLKGESFIEAIHSIRAALYDGEHFEQMSTQAPWMREDLAYSFRFIKQRLDSRREHPPMDALFMLERAMEG